jgi:hypothetical protein
MPLTEDQFIRVEPQYVAFTAYGWKRANGSWPTPRQMHQYLASMEGYPLEHAEHDVLVALDTGCVYGLPTIVGRRLGEVEGDWRAPLEDDDNGFRLALPERSAFNAAAAYDLWDEVA